MKSATAAISAPTAADWTGGPRRPRWTTNATAELMATTTRTVAAARLMSTRAAKTRVDTTA